MTASDERHVELKAKGDPALGVGAGAIHHVVLLGVGAALNVREIGTTPDLGGVDCVGIRYVAISRILEEKPNGD